jgi:hypothetical protein
VEAFGKAKEDLLRTFLPLPNGIPSYYTFYQVFARLDPQRFGGCGAAWITGVNEAAGLQDLAIDEKAVRSAPRSTFSGCLHLVSAWAAENRLILGQAADVQNGIAPASVRDIAFVLQDVQQVLLGAFGP